MSRSAMLHPARPSPNCSCLQGKSPLHVYPLTSSLLYVLYAGPSQKLCNTLGREAGPGTTREANQTSCTPVGSPVRIPTDSEGSWRITYPRPSRLSRCTACALAFALLYSHTKTIRKSSILHRFSAELHSRSVDETLWTTEYEEIIEKGCDEAAAARTNDRTPDPIVVTKSEHCKLQNVTLAHRHKLQ